MPCDAGQREQSNKPFASVLPVLCRRPHTFSKMGDAFGLLFVAYVQDSRQNAASARLAVKDGLVNNDRRPPPATRKRFLLIRPGFHCPEKLPEGQSEKKTRQQP